MLKSAESLYTAAYAMHYKDRDFHQALALYYQLVDQYPSSKEADYARTQIANIEEDPKFAPSPEAYQAAQAALALQQEKQSEIERLRANQSFTLKQMLTEHIGKVIGINALDPGTTEAAELVAVQADHFTVQIAGLAISIPYSQIIKIVAAPSGTVAIGTFKGDFPVLLKVFDFAIYKGAIGVGMSVPL